MDGKRTVFIVVTEFHLWCVEAGFAVNKITNRGVFYDHFGPKWVARKTKEEITFVGGYFNNDIGPASYNMIGLQNLMMR